MLIPGPLRSDDIPALKAGPLREALEARYALRNGELLLDVEYSHRLGGDFKRQYHVYFDGETCRMGRVRDNGPGTDSFLEIDVIKGNKHIWYTTMESEPGLPVASWVKDLTVSPESPHEVVPHPSYLGLATCGCEIVTYDQLRLCITRPGNPGDTTDVAPGERDGERCRIVSRTGSLRGQEYQITGWLLPRLGNSVVKVEMASENQGYRQVNTVVTDYQTVEGIHVPKSVHFTSVVNGALKREETVQVTVLKLNSGIDPSTFELGGLGIRAGTPFAVYPDDYGGAYIWDGSKLVVDWTAPSVPPSKRFGGAVAERNRPERWSPLRWVLIANAIALAIVGVVCAIRLLRRES